MRLASLSVLVTILATCTAALAQSPAYGIGKPASEKEIKAWDSGIAPDGKGLPPGSGTSKQGAKVYAERCAKCHGATGKEGPFDRMVGGKGTLNTDRPVKTIGSYWPYATTIWDYINRAMPDDQPGSLSADQVYALTAFLLHQNEIIQENDVIDRNSLPKIQMPNRNGFVPDPRPE